MTQFIQTILLYNFAITIPLSPSSNLEMKKISKNGMEICWEYRNDRIFFEMHAPTTGWVTIGFNSKNDIVGSYLLMGNVINEEVNVVEHYTLSAGNYKPITELGATANVDDIFGEEKDGKTKIRFSLPIQTRTKYGVDLTQARGYTMHIAYSRDDDFQHHSLMRAAVRVEL